MTLQVALIDVEAATPGLRTITMVIPQARILSTLKSRRHRFLSVRGWGPASLTGVILAAGVDRRIGGGSIKTAAQWRWGDAENVMKDWAKLAVDRLSVWAKGGRPA